ncbi:MAG: tetratricopeptide (TPR) repeat protein [Crocinitomicaceae bacterium]|jgi:tetratricopeptide (TPR) repeat protein
MSLKPRNIFLICCIFFFSTNVQSQNATIDSLETKLLLHPKKDTIRVNQLIVLIHEVYEFDVNKAENLIEEAEIICKELNYTKGKAHATYYKGHAAIIKSDFNRGINYFNEALKLYKTLNLKKGISYSLNGIGVAYYFQGDYTKAIEFYNKSASIDREMDNLGGVAGSFNNIGNIYADQGEYEKAIGYYEKAKNIKEQTEDFEGVARSYNNIGSIYGEQGNFPKALENFNKALTICDENGFENHSLFFNIGSIYQMQGNYTKASLYLNRVLALNRKQDNKQEISACLNALGDFEKEQSYYKKALVFYNEALSIDKAINSKMGMAISLNNIGDMQIALKQESQALGNYEAALELNKEIGSQLGICRSYFGMSKVYHGQAKNIQALQFALESQKISVKLELLILQKEVSELLSKIYSEIGQYDKAFASHQQFKVLNDSLFNKENIEKITQLEYEYKYKQELESASIRELKLTKTVNTTSQNLEESERKTFITVIVLLLISIFSASVIFFLRLRNVKSKNQSIMIEQKLLRSQMTPHFIFNSLSVLQGMILNKEEGASVSYLSKFSKLLRTILENSRHKTVLLSAELEATENYMALQNLDSNPLYNYQMLNKVGEKDAVLKVPPMLIQPFVENAIEHAFIGQKENREINVEITFINKQLKCTISDNGIGISASIPKNNKNKDSLATTITSERLAILSKDFKVKGAITIEDRKLDGEKGTLVTIIIPYKIDRIL